MHFELSPRYVTPIKFCLALSMTVECQIVVACDGDFVWMAKASEPQQTRLRTLPGCQTAFKISCAVDERLFKYQGFSYKKLVL